MEESSRARCLLQILWIVEIAAPPPAAAPARAKHAHDGACDAPECRVLSRGANILYSSLFGIHTLRDYTNLVRAFRGRIILRALERYGTEGVIIRRGFESVPELVLKLRPLLPRVFELPLVIDHSVLERESQMPVLRTIRASSILIAVEMLARVQRRLGDL